MASFTAFLEVGGNSYPLHRYEFSVHQETDTLGRPSSPVLGGIITCTLSPPSSSDSFLYQWMMSPTLQQDGKIRLLQAQAKATEKTISFFNAYCTSMDLSFMPGIQGGGGSSLIQLQINPQRVAIGPVVHDNNWPLASHGAGERFSQKQAERPTAPPQKEEEPSAFMEGLHGVLDVVGMIPVIGEVADLANAAIYASEGRYGEAALSAASAIPVVGNFVGATKMARRGAKLLQKASKLVPPKLLSKLDEGAAVIQKVCKEDPIDVATGMMLTQRIDVELPGPIPFVWERIWFSASDHRGPLGYGWHHRYDMGLTLDEASSLVVLRNAEGRHVGFESSTQPGQPVFDRTSGLTLYPPAPDDPSGMPWRIWDKAAQVWYVFAQPRTNGAYQPLHAVANNLGQHIELSYDGDRLAQIVDSAGRLLTLRYNDQGLVTQLVGPHPDEAEQTLTLAAYTYSETGDLTGHTDAEGSRWQYRYEHHLMVQSTSPTGLSFYWQYDGIDTEARCVHTWGDGNIHEGRFTYLDDHTTLFESIDGLTRYMHRDGLVLQEIGPLGGESRWQYNEYNELVAETNPLDQTIRYGYDEGGNRIWTQYADGSREQTSYDEFDRLISFTDGRGSTWRLNYNQRGLTETQLDPLEAETRYEYDEFGRLITVTDALGQVTRLRYTEQHQMAHLVTPGRGTAEEQIRSGAYDALGRITTLTDPTGAMQQRRYSLTGQLLEVIEPDGSQQQYSYDPDGNLTAVRQAEQTVEFVYTGTGQLAERRQAGQRVLFQYDAESRLVGVINEADQHYRFELDALGQVITEIGFDGLTRRYERDRAGQVTRILRPTGRSTDYSYTEGGQVRSVIYSDGTQHLFGYDEAGALVKAQSNGATVRLERDALGRVVREEQGDHWVEYSYDALGRRTRIRSSLEADISLTLDAAANVTQMQASNWQAQVEYDPRGLAVQLTMNGAVQTTWQYDALSRPVRQQISSRHTRAGQQRTYHWNEADQLTRIDDSSNGSSRFAYDPIGTLIGALHANEGQDVRQADAMGNLYRSLARTDREYGPGGQLRQSAGGIRYYYDEEGNLTSKTLPDNSRWVYEWDGVGQLKSVKRPDGYKVSFSYDALGRRLSKHFRGKTTHWLWAGDKPLHEWAELRVSSGADSVEEVITWLFDEDSFTPLGKLQAGAAYSIVADHLGTPLVMFDAHGETAWAAQLDSYGLVRQRQGKATDCPFRYQGQYEDIETELYYNRFRYYDPRQGGYISQDPIGLAGGLLMQGYVADTATQVDIFGLSEGSTTLGNRMERVGMTHGIPNFPRGDFRAHHVIPHEVWTSHQTFFDNIGLGRKPNGFNPKDAAANGVFMPKSETVGRRHGFDNYHSGSHGGFNRQMDNSIRDIRRRFDTRTITRTQARKEVSALQKAQRKLLSARNALPCGRLS